MGYADYEDIDRDEIIDDMDADMELLEEMRAERLKQLRGTYVITCLSPYTGKILYYQDRSISRKSFWTEFLSNAFGFRSPIAAHAYCKRMRYNKPNVRYVNPDTGQLEPYRKGEIR